MPRERHFLQQIGCLISEVRMRDFIFLIRGSVSLRRTYTATKDTYGDIKFVKNSYILHSIAETSIFRRK